MAIVKFVTLFLFLKYLYTHICLLDCITGCQPCGVIYPLYYVSTHLTDWQVILDEFTIPAVTLWNPLITFTEHTIL